MLSTAARGFPKEALRNRYDVEAFQEDPWHRYSAEQTEDLIKFELSKLAEFHMLLNAGSGVYSINPPRGREVRVDLFRKPLAGSRAAVCTDIQALPFRSSTFDVVICVGEVLGYCDPAAAISELVRVLTTKGLFICDFESSKGIRHWLKNPYGRAADLVSTEYNGSIEHTWVYDPGYICSLLKQNGLTLRRAFGIHTWSALGRRLGMSAEGGLRLQGFCRVIPFPAKWAELTTFVAEKL